MSKHTPGPWKWNGQAAVWAGAICICKFDHEDTNTDEFLPKLGANGAGWSREQARANARLIAAAPELLNALIAGAQLNMPDFLEWIAARLVNVHGEDPNVDYVQTLRHRAKLCREAIAKATGTGA